MKRSPPLYGCAEQYELPKTFPGSHALLLRVHRKHRKQGKYVPEWGRHILTGVRSLPSASTQRARSALLWNTEVSRARKRFNSCRIKQMGMLAENQLSKNHSPENQYYSYNLGELPEGCRYCVRGEKLVFFVTGICPRKCYFCPVSDQKFGKDVCFANERPVAVEEDILTEARAMRAEGAGITGGDPLARLDKTIAAIKLLKATQGKGFHIHLYTSLNLVTGKALQQLADAGLDEIRFHLDLDSEKFWEKLLLAGKHPWTVGVELPLIPTKEKELKKVIDFIRDKVSFLTLNELEMADNSQSSLAELGFRSKNSLSYAVEGSLETGLRLLKYVENGEEKIGKEAGKSRLKVHLCTARLKDAVQLANRLKREASGMKRRFDQVDNEGLLIRGALYLPELAPGFGYRRRLAECRKEEFLERLQPFAEKLQQELNLSGSDFYLDHDKPRILLSARKILPLKRRFKQWGLIPAIVKEYPTADQLEIEVEFF